MVAVLFWPRIKTRRIFRNFVGIHIFLKNMPRESFEIFVERENCSFGKEWLKFSSFPFDPTMIIFKDEGFRWRYFFTEFFQRECVWENLYFLELIRKGDVNKDFIRWKEFCSNLVCFEIWFSIFAKNWWKYILRSFKRSNFSFIRNYFVSWDAWFFFLFHDWRKKGSRNFITFVDRMLNAISSKRFKLNDIKRGYPWYYITI